MPSLVVEGTVTAALILIADTDSDDNVDITGNDDSDDRDYIDYSDDRDHSDDNCEQGSTKVETVGSCSTLG